MPHIFATGYRSYALLANRIFLFYRIIFKDNLNILK